MAHKILTMTAIGKLDKLKRITLPVTILESLGLQPNDDILIELADGKLTVSKMPDLASSDTIP